MPVLASAAKEEDFKVYLSALGTVTPIHTVTVKTRVEGHLIELPVKEGQLVEKGDLLARIDPRPYYPKNSSCDTCKSDRSLKYKGSDGNLSEEGFTKWVS